MKQSSLESSQLADLNRSSNVEELILKFERFTGSDLPFNVEILVRKAWNKGWEQGAKAVREMMK